MRLNHAQLAVSDVAANRTFFETYFGLRCVVDRGDNMAVLTDDGNGSILALNNFKKAAEPAYPDDLSFHIGFEQDCRERANEIHASLKAGGFGPDEPRELHGAWTFYVKAPGGFFVEVFYPHYDWMK
jgi:catechol 2,3-dioxygenase-like lactoylglutathione lyase family enzyme